MAQEPEPLHSTGPGDSLYDAHGGNARPLRAQAPSSLHGDTQPIRDAVVNSAVQSEGAASVDPELVAQITEQVMRSLKLSGLAAPPVNVSAPASTASQSPASGGLPAVPPRNVYTPPSPDHHDTFAASFGPSLHDVQSHVQPRDEPALATPSEPLRPSQPTVKSEERQQRPKTAFRKETDGDATTLEKVWQPLFDVQACPTPRLSQFLRGLAIHIIEDYEPRHSIVIPPHKMIKFYDEVRLAEEIYPWSVIFGGGKVTSSSLSHLYRDLKCQHHFVQTLNTDKPSIPALTPVGFETWMTHIIRANPDMEFDRFSKAVLDMPISNADDSKERFPKQLSRRLFPKRAHEQIKFDLDEAMTADEAIVLNNVPSVPLSRVSTNSHNARRPSVSVPPNITSSVPPPSSFHERERKPYSASSSEAAVEDSIPAAVKIERERNPYTAAPGGGKVHENGREGASARSNTLSGASRPTLDPEEALNRRHRSGSVAGAGGPAPVRRRVHSPSVNDRAYTRSDTEIPVGSYGSTGSNMYGMDSDDDSRRYSQAPLPRRHASEIDPRQYGYPPPPPPQQTSNSYSGYPTYPPPPPQSQPPIDRYSR